HLQKLGRELNETVNLQILVNNEVLFLVSVEDHHRLRVAQRVGTRGPLTPTQEASCCSRSSTQLRCALGWAPGLAHRLRGRTPTSTGCYVSSTWCGAGAMRSTWGRATRGSTPSPYWCRTSTV